MRRPDYGISAPPATPSLEAILRARIERDGPLPFEDYMAAALYDPVLGYYARETRQIGRGGDFFTSVSVGPLFGELLARRFLREWRDSGSPARWRIIECGAHDGTLAADVLGAISRLAPAAFAALEYAIPEPLPVLQAAQRRTLDAFTGKIRFITDPSELFADPLPGVAFGEIVLLWLAIAATLVAFWQVKMAAGLLLVPYLAWVSFAAALNFTIWRLNS